MPCNSSDCKEASSRLRRFFPATLKVANKDFEQLKLRSGALDVHLRTAETWEIAETLFCVSKALEQDRDTEW
jgi:hypothetical protein